MIRSVKVTSGNTSNSLAEDNCDIVRCREEQSEAKHQSVTQVNLIQQDTEASLLGNGEVEPEKNTGFSVCKRTQETESRYQVVEDRMVRRSNTLNEDTFKKS